MSEEVKDNLFSINFRRWQRYNYDVLSLEEIVLFEYLMMWGMHVQFKQFYCSNSKIAADTNLTRRKIQNGIERFASMGLISVQLKGLPAVNHFTINTDKIIEQFTSIYKFAQNGKLDDTLYKLLCTELENKFAQNGKQEEPIKKPIKETNKGTKEKKGNDTLAKAELLRLSYGHNLLVELEKKYNARREFLSKDSATKYPDATLGYKTKKEIKALAFEALDRMGASTIDNAWRVFTDKITSGDINPQKVFLYFFSKKDDGSFDVIDSMADIHGTDYSYQDKK